MSECDGSYPMKEEDELGESFAPDQEDYLGNSKEEENLDESRTKTKQKNSGGTKVILVTYRDEFEKNEAVGLVEAAGYRVVQQLAVKRLSSAEFGVGTGKAEELRKLAEDTKSQMIIVDDRLSSSQAHNLAKFTHQQVIDRERLILDIFDKRATTTEGKLQVNLAELKYEIPRAREAVKVSLKGEQAGFMG